MNLDLSAQERAALLGIARAAILADLGLAAAPPLPTSGPLAAPVGAFVTLGVDGALRGCMGTLRPDGSLAATVARMAVAAAREDPRFPPLAPGEVETLTVAVSAVGPLRPLADPRALPVGGLGVAVRRGWSRGVLLPWLAVREGWDAEAFLKHACLKAGLPARAWSEPDTVLEVFEAVEFGEEPVR